MKINCQIIYTLFNESGYMKRNLLIAGGLMAACVVSIIIFVPYGLNSVSGMLYPFSEYNAYNSSFNNSNTGLTETSTAMINFKTFVNGITPIAVYNYVLHEINWHLFKKDNSYEKSTYLQSNYYTNWANDIKKSYPLNDNRQKGEAVFNYTYGKIVTKWHVHDNTACPIQDVAKYHEANCAETTKIVYNLCLAVRIPKEDVQCVHSTLQHHYWVQIHCDGRWIDLDASHAADETYHVTKFGLAEPASDVQAISVDEVA